jgi:NitT/TauT family transport system ATP-binding protein
VTLTEQLREPGSVLGSSELNRLAPATETVSSGPAGAVGQAIVASSLCKQFTTKGKVFTALEGVEIAIGERQFCSLIGPSGCGKSTLLRLLADVTEPTSGSVSVFGASPKEGRRKRDFGFVFQDPTLLPWRSALGNTELPLQLAGWDRSRRRAKAMELLALVGLEGFEHSLPASLSGGMARRVAIARALTLDPKVLFLDEPFAGLDEILRQQMNEELQRIWMETGTTAVLVTHNVSEAVYLSDQICVMGGRPGRITDRTFVHLERPRTVDRILDPEFVEIQRVVSAQLASAVREFQA